MTSSSNEDAPLSWTQASGLGLIQGLTEFIPVSSSAHLNIAHALLGRRERQLPFDVLLSAGTTLALGWSLRREWKALLTQPAKRPLLRSIGLACVPAVALAALSPLRHLEDESKFFSSPAYNGLWMILGGALLLFADRRGRQARSLDELSHRDALLIGASQALALVPGFSRSGTTMATGLLLGLQREEAARFSFLLALPISLGALVYEGRRLRPAQLGAGPREAAGGVFAALVSGLGAIRLLLLFLRRRDVSPFFWWRLLVGLAALARFHQEL